MTYPRSLTLGAVLLASATIALSQPTPPAAPPAPPAPAVAPMPAAAPTPVAAPLPPAAPFELWDADQVLTPEMQEKLERVKEQMKEMKLELKDDFKFDLKNDFKFEFDQEALREQMEAARASVDAARITAEATREAMKAIGPAMAYAGKGFGLGFGNGFAFSPQIAPPTPPAPAVGPARRIFNMSSDSAYSNGQRALDNRQWDDAVAYFNQVISRNSNRVDGALYWKAYALGKLGKRDESLATIAELRKNHANSRWLDDAKALELEVNQGKPVSPEAQNDEDMKLLILASGIHSDFDRFYPALEKIIKGPGAPRLKKNAIYVLSDNSSQPKAQALLEQVAKGGGNPDLQVQAIRYLTERRRGTSAAANTGQLLSEIYNGTTDTEVKRAVIESLINIKDKDRLINLLKTEKNSDLRERAVRFFGEQSGNAELWQLYQGETSPEGKIMIIRNAHRNGNPDKLVEILRNEKEQKVRIAAVQALGSYMGQGEKLVSVYANEQDPQVKSAIINAVADQRDGKAMVDLAKAEKDQKLKIRLIERMANMKNCKECADYMMEILNK
jgi:hypothetical protein